METLVDLSDFPGTLKAKPSRPMGTVELKNQGKKHVLQLIPAEDAIPTTVDSVDNGNILQMICGKPTQKFYPCSYRTFDCLTIGFPILALVSTFVAFTTVTGSAEVTHGERTNSAANFFERAGAVKAGLSFGFGEHAMTRTIETQTMFIRHTATEVQRRTAEKNAKVYYAQLAPKKKAALKAKKIRYLLVPTVRSEETSPKAKEVRMTWDTQSESLADNYVYEFENPPAVGTVAKVGDHTAESIP